MSEQQFKIDIEELYKGADGKPAPEEYPDIEKLETGTAQARQKNVEVKEDDALVDQIRRVGGLQQAIVVEAKDDGRFEIICGQRRWGAYKILVKEDSSRYQNIRAKVIRRDPKLTDEEKKVISFVENYGRKQMEKSDYADVIEYFYKKYGRKNSTAAQALGITVPSAKKYLTYARLSDKVEELIKQKEFTIDTAIKALESLGEDEDSVDDDMLIATAKALKKLVPARRKLAIKKLKKQRPGEKDVEKAISEVPTKLVEIRIIANEDQVEQLDRFKVKHAIDEDTEAASDAMQIGLNHDLEEEEE